MASSNFDFTPDGALQGRIVWSSTSKGPDANSSDVTAILYARRTDTYGPTKGQSWSGYVKIVGKDNSNQTNINFSSSVSVGNSWVEMAKVTLSNAKHNDDGSGSATISGSVTGPSGTGLSGNTSSGSKIVTLDKIARYATGVTFSLKSKTVNTLIFNWSANETCSAIKYGTSASSLTETSVNAKSGTFTISSLTPNTSYTVYFNAKRKDSSLYLASNLSLSNQVTYKIATLATVPNANIGAAQRITWENPSGASLTLKLCKTDNTQIINYGTVTGTNITVTPTASTIYALTPNSNTYTARYVLTTTANGVSYTNYKNFTFTVTNSNPTFSDFDYDDINSTTLALTGNNSKILIKGYSNNKITVSSDNFPTAKNSATMKTLRFTQGTKTDEQSAEGIIAAVGASVEFDSIDNNTMVVSAVDSRGNSTSVTKTLNSTYYKNYSPVTIKSVTATRSSNGVGQIVTLKVSGTFWNNSFGGVSNDITSATYQYKLSSSSGSFSTAKTITLTKSGSNFSFSGTIEGDLGAEGFSVEDSFIIKVTIKDKLSTKSQNVTLGPGTPAISIYKNKVAIGKKYDTTEGGKFQVDGVNYSSIKNETISNANFEFYAYKFQKQVMIRIFATASITMASGTNVEIGTLPEGYRPSFLTGGPIVLRTAGYANNLGLLIVRANGKVELVQTTGNPLTTVQIVGSLNYFVY